LRATFVEPFQIVAVLRGRGRRRSRVHLLLVSQVR
jgi:hypothetical protein